MTGSGPTTLYRILLRRMGAARQGQGRTWGPRDEVDSLLLLLLRRFLSRRPSLPPSTTSLPALRSNWWWWWAQRQRRAFLGLTFVSAASSSKALLAECKVEPE